ncbi:hypothetical protein H0N96_01335 [Candidatus Micrarchaeota archaeon]|nr:hypothetical protein [Candidatus Micrarchaeota archaeon]
MSGKETELKSKSFLDKALDYAGLVFFNEDSILALEKRASPKNLLLVLIVSSLVAAFPTDLATATLQGSVYNYFVVLVVFAVLLAIVFAVARVLGSKQGFATTAFLIAVTFLSVQLFFLPFEAAIAFLFESVLGNAAAVPLALSLIPYYQFALFGFAAETASKNAGWKGILTALASITLVFFAYQLLALVTV